MQQGSGHTRQIDGRATTGSSQQSRSQPNKDNSDILDAGIGQQLLHIVLQGGQNDTPQTGYRSHTQQNQTDGHQVRIN